MSKVSRGIKLSGPVLVAVVTAGAALFPATSSSTPLASAPRASAAEAAAPQPRGEVVVGIPSVQQEVLDATLVAGNGKQYSGQSTDWLIGLAPNGLLSKASGVLSNWQSRDGRTYVLTVRRGITWHDGRPLTAADVAFSFEMMKRPTAACLSCGVVKDQVQSVSTPNRYTVRVVLNRTSFNFIDAMSPIDGDFKVVPRHYFAARGADAYARNGLGSGPWIFEGRQIGQFVRFRANTRYWRKAGIPKFRFLRLVFISDSTTCLTRLRTGEADMCALSLDQLSDARANRITVGGAKNVASHNIIFPLSDDPAVWSNKVAFRRALSLAINKAAIMRRFYPPAVGTAQNRQTGLLFSSVTRGFDPKLPQYRYDPNEARRLLRSINYDGTPVNLWSYVLGVATELPAINEVIAQMWTSVGVKVNIIPIDFGSFFARLTARPINLDHRVVHAALVTPRTRPGVLGNITTWMLSKSDGGVTGVYWRPTFIAQRYQRLVAIRNSAQLGRELRQLNRDLRNEFWAIPINLRHQTWGVSRKVKSWQPIKGNPSELNLASLTPR